MIRLVCEYEYDYENRIVKITKDGQTKAEFAYDTLASRIEKKDLVDPNNTRRYYYNYNWQVLAEYDGAGSYNKLFIYGNYIDEVLYTQGTGPGTPRYYVHDHLYSPAALVYANGTVLERCEYDAYGNPYILDTQYAPRTTSHYGNPYLFTGRRVDILDSGSLKIQYNRNRYYDYYTGRWLTHDPLGITPNPQKPNRFVVPDQYQDGLGLYSYANNNPIVYFDQWGLFLPRRCWPNITAQKCGSCGPDITFALASLRMKLFINWFMIWDPNERERRCDAIEGLSAQSSWDIDELHNETISGGTCDCQDTVTVNGGCYCVHEANYFLWGVANKLCGKGLSWTLWKARLWSNFIAPPVAALTCQTCEGSPASKVNWAEAGFLGDLNKLKPSKSSHSSCKVKKPPKIWGGTLTPHWGD